MTNDLSQSHVFRPELLSRRGEVTAWILTIILLATGLVLVSQGGASFLVILLALVFLLSASSISLGNWMDRHTEIQLNDEGIWFRNGLRDVRLSWPEINHVRVLPSPLGDKILVQGPGAHFAFRTLGEVNMHGEVKGRMGFADGGKILQLILRHSDLQPVQRKDDRIYYARK